MSEKLLGYLQAVGLAEPLATGEANELAAELDELTGQQVYSRSITAIDKALFFLTRDGERKSLGVISADLKLHRRFSGEMAELFVGNQNLMLTLAETSPANAESLRSILPFLKPITLGLKKSAGCGDRLGLATPGHIRAIRTSTMAPILAQQSIRENFRTGRTPQQVMDEAMWGILQEGWRGGFGADADHLKNTDDIDSCAAAGFTFYTIDPGEHVDNEANTAPVDVLKAKVAALDWAALETTWEATQAALSHKIDLGTFSVTISEEDLLRSAAKYGRVVAHTVRMYRHLEKVMAGKDFELEMSVDETETVTTLAEHIYIAHELKRLGVKWVSLAPRYVGDFEKGVDYIGDLAEFEKSFAQHLAVSKAFGPYKLSLHSGSDKFSVYPIASRVAGELVHLKTAGTSYLEALRAIGKVNPSLFRDIVAFAKERYPIDRASYHVSAEVSKMQDVAALANDQLTTLLDDFHAREILHVTFGSVLHHPDFREPFFATLRRNEGVYYDMLEIHFGKHFAPFDEALAAAV
ncbi:MAG TPA: tagaturonate epimerase family protein [Blastocatellia bacterium]|nr:tagaturonate epimerase family protein [Blastocatellia bacterium]